MYHRHRALGVDLEDLGTRKHLTLAGNLLLAGYIGCGNHGDNAMMYGFTRAAENQGYSVVVLSGDPDATHRDFSTRAFDRKSSSQVDRAIAECDALVFPGGSVFQDVTSVRSVFYYANLIKKAKAAKKKILLLGQGVGPLTTFLGKRTAAGAFQMADVIAVRDPGSVQALTSLGVKGKIHITADPAYLLLPGPKSDEEGGFAVGGMKVAGIAPRPLGRGRDVATLMGEFCRLLYQSGTMPVLIAMDTAEDLPLNNEISKRQGGRIPDIHRSTTPMQIQSRMSRMDCVVAMRLHAGILATTVDVPRDDDQLRPEGGGVRAAAGYRVRHDARGSDRSAHAGRLHGVYKGSGAEREARGAQARRVHQARREEHRAAVGDGSSHVRFRRCAGCVATLVVTQKPRNLETPNELLVTRLP